MTLEYFMRWRVDVLKDYIKQRGLGTTGAKLVLATKAYKPIGLKDYIGLHMTGQCHHSIRVNASSEIGSTPFRIRFLFSRLIALST